MPFIGLGLHVLIALFFAIHAIRNRHDMYWLMVLFLFPLLGSIVYFVAVFLPSSRLERTARQAVNAAANSLDPRRALREAQSAHAYAPTAQTQMRLAAALLEAGAFDEAASHYEACLKGPFASDLEIRLGAARAGFAGERWAMALEHLAYIRQTNPDFRTETVSLLWARTLAGAGRRAEARVEFEDALARFGSFEVRVEFAIWAIISGEIDLAGRLQAEIQSAMQRWNRHTQELNRPLVRRLHAAYEVARSTVR